MLSELSQFAEYGVIGVTLVILALGALMFKSFMAFIKESDARHLESNREIIKSNKGLKKVVEETYRYIKLKNGSFEKLIEKTSNKLDNCEVNREGRS